MTIDIEKLITKCVGGRTPHDVVSELEEELVDTRSVRMSVLKDLASHGLDIDSSRVSFDASSLKLEVSSDMLSTRRSDIEMILEAYERTYVGVEFSLIECSSTET